MSFLLLRSTAQRILFVPGTVPVASLHTSPVLQTSRWKKYKWTPWPWPLGMKHLRNVFRRDRPGYTKLRRRLPQPGSEEGQITGPFAKKKPLFFQAEAGKILRLFARQCEVYAAQRIRRAQQTFQLYRNLYNRQMVGTLMLNMSSTIKRPAPRNLMALVGATVFAMEKPEVCITDCDIDKCLDDLNNWSVEMKENHSLPDWENVAQHPTCNVWQRTPPGLNPPEYRALGTFADIPARTFFRTQLDVAYRQQWDKLVVKLEVIDRDEATGAEVLQWVSHYPFPFNPREYVYQRRYRVDENAKTMIVISKSCESPKCPPNPAYVRVKSYYSALLIRPHRTFDETGFDYVLCYTDDPQTFLPKMAVQYAAKSNLPDFMLKLHAAAKALLERSVRPTVSLSSTSQRNKENLPPGKPADSDILITSMHMPTP